MLKYGYNMNIRVACNILEINKEMNIIKLRKM